MIKLRLLGVYAFLLILLSCGSDKNNTGSDNDSDTDTTVTDSTEIDTVSVDTTAMMTDTVAPKEIPGQEDKAQAANVVKRVYDLSEYGFGITIELPSGTNISVSELDEAILKFGQDFVLEVGENYLGTLDQIKANFKGNMHNQFLGYVVDEPNGFVRKIKTNGVESHNLYYNVKTDDMDIMIISTASQAYTKAEIMEMWKACKTIKVK